MAETSNLLRVFFFPLMSPGHMIPMVDMAKLFTRSGAAITIITTPRNEPLIRPTVDRANSAAAGCHPPIDLLILPFPESVAHLIPASGEHLGAISKSEYPSLMTAIYALQDPLDGLLRLHRPDCIVSDAMFPWTSFTALELGIPRLVFYGPGAFLHCIHRCIEFQRPQDAVASDSERFAVEGLPDRIEMTRSEMSSIFLFDDIIRAQRVAEEKSFGVIVNSFYELEPAYAELFRRKPETKAWYVGPVTLCKRDEADRGGEAHPGVERWLNWLDSKPAGTVVYVCFGSLCEFSSSQLRELALGLEASGYPFVWILRGGAPGPALDWLPEGYEDRIKRRGLVIRGWAPQVVLLGHSAVGGFVTHCGWNSTLEGVTAGKPMATWPLSYDQFLNEKFLTEVARIGVRVRRAEATGPAEVSAEEVAMALGKLMDAGEEAETRRRRARDYAAKARAAMEEGGSSFEDIHKLVAELAEIRARRDGEKTGRSCS